MFDFDNFPQWEKHLQVREEKKKKRGSRKKRKRKKERKKEKKKKVIIGLIAEWSLKIQIL